MRWTAAWVGVVLAACAGPAPEEASAPTSAPPAVAELMERARVPGLARAVVVDGEVGAVELYGVADRDRGAAVTAATRFEAASLSKPVFATVVLRMAERGEIDLDRPLFELLPYERIAHDPRARLLTARLVLSHQTGLPNWGPEKLEFTADPGERFGYSGEGYVYLQRVVEQLTGEPLDEVARREVFEPLGMADSAFAFPAAATLDGGDGAVRAPGPVSSVSSAGEGVAAAETAPDTVASPHDRTGAPQPKRMPDEANAAASLHTTAGDYARFVAAWMGVAGVPALLRDETRSEALAPAVRIEPDDDDPPGQRAAAERTAWGLGWGLYEPAAGAEPVVFHWGDNGDFKAFVAFERGGSAGVVYFANSANGLAPGARLASPPGVDLAPLLRWLGYPQIDDPGWTERLDGAIAEGEGRYDDALTAFRAAVELDPDDEPTVRRIEWLQELVALESSPVRVPAETLASYAGRYGPRILRVEEGGLVYQREGRSPFRLIPLSATEFAFEGLVDFRLEVVLDAVGTPVAVRGHYLDGSTDENPRTGTDP